jgi:hypothetical protein
MALQNYQEEVLFRMYDEQIIGHNYKPIQRIATIIRWENITKQYSVKEKFPSVFRHLIKKGYIDDHGKRGKAGSLSKLGVSYVLGKLAKEKL